MENTLTFLALVSFPLGILLGGTVAYFFTRKHLRGLLAQELEAKQATLSEEIARLKAENTYLQDQLTFVGSADARQLQNHIAELQKTITELHLALYQQRKHYEERLQALRGGPTPVHLSDGLPEAHRVKVSPSGGGRQGDDLTAIEGITPEIAKQLQAMGVYTYEDIARWSSVDIYRVAQHLGIDHRRILTENWILQAQMLWYERYRT